MTRDEFMTDLRTGLTGLSPQDIDDILADYHSHFSDGRAAGRSDQEIAASLGDPLRLARELRVEAGFRRWQADRSAGNLAGIIVALLGLATIDFLLILPALGFIAGVLFAFAATVFALCIAGLTMLVSLLPIGFLSDLGSMLGRGLAGAGLLAGGIGGGALFILLVEGLARLAVKYARLHYRLLTSAGQAV